MHFGNSITGEKLVICDNCRHLYFETMPSKQQIDDYYGQQYTGEKSQILIQENNRVYYRAHLLEIKKRLEDAGAPLVLVDYGSSIPVLCSEAIALGFSEVYSVDYSKDAKEWGSKNGVIVMDPDEFLQSSISKIGVIRFSHVLEHLIDPISKILEIRDKLAENGHIYITQPLFPVCKLVEFDKSIDNSVWPEHLHFFTASSFSELAKRTKLEIVEFFGFQEIEKVEEHFGGVVDTEFCVNKLNGLNGLMPNCFDIKGTYPLFYGENMVSWLKKAN